MDMKGTWKRSVGIKRCEVERKGSEQEENRGQYSRNVGVKLWVRRGERQRRKGEVWE